jgi:hypothetical protein
MAPPITSGRDNRFANLEDIYEREESIREEQTVTVAPQILIVLFLRYLFDNNIQ